MSHYDLISLILTNKECEVRLKNREELFHSYPKTSSTVYIQELDSDVEMSEVESVSYTDIFGNKRFIE